MSKRKRIPKLYDFKVKLSHAERDKLRKVARERGIRAAELIRKWINEKLKEAK
jgi:flagellar biosynthesis/type III secretory pathway M-ring protein FliF/YscJ